MIKFLSSLLIFVSINGCLYNPIVRELLWKEDASKTFPFLSLFAFGSLPSNSQTPSRVITLSKDTIVLQKTENEQIVAVLKVDDKETSTSFTYTSSDPSVATVSSSGIVSAISTGPATITIKETDGDASTTCRVNVYAGYVYSSLDLISQVAVLTMNTSTGVLTSNGSVSTIDLSPTGIAVDPYGKYLYTGNFNSDTISRFNVSAANGSLTYVGATAAPSNPRNIAISPNGKFLYLAAETTSSIRGYSINPSDGNLSFIAATNVSTGVIQPVIDPSGKYLVAIYPTTNQLSSFSIDSTTGNLSLIATSGSFDSQGLAAFHPSGKFLYVGSNPNLTVLSFNDQNGALSIVSTVNQNGVPNGIAVHPNGKYLYSANISDASVTVYAINTTNGALSLLSTYASGGIDIRYIAIDPTGKFAYIAQNGATTMLQLLIDQNTGLLSSLGSVNASGNQWNLFIK